MEKHEKKEISIIPNCEILITDEDKNGTEISKMSNFFEIGINNNLSITLNNSFFEIVNKFSLLNVSEYNDFVKIIDNTLNKKGKVELIADLDKLPEEIKKKLKNGENVINKSKQYANRYRPVVENNNKHKIQKEIVLRKVVRKPNADSAFRNIAIQQKLQQIDAKINQLNELCCYQIDLQVNDMVYKPFDEARTEILYFQKSDSDDNRREHLKKASEHLESCIAGIHTSIKTSQDHLIKLDNKKMQISLLDNVDKYIEFVGRDLSQLTKIVGLLSQIYVLLGKDNENSTLISQYKYYMINFFNKPVNNDGQSLAILIHNNCAYNKINKDAWYNMYLQVNDLDIDKINQNEDKELYYLEEGEEYNE